MQGAIVKMQIAGSTDMNGLHKELHAVENVKEVYFLAGPTDVMCHVEAMDVDAVVSTVVKIRGMKGVTSTDTRFILPLH
ncbi:MAG TPA: Lrp/AsnC ligand binding domain-containing protein [Anaerolineae bacterium]|nr:Lrp/AsnC ligand binding domain-containing protein [Anaerolineae bacterium]